MLHVDTEVDNYVTVLRLFMHSFRDMDLWTTSDPKGLRLLTFHCSRANTSVVKSYITIIYSAQCHSRNVSNFIIQYVIKFWKISSTIVTETITI